MKKIKLTQGKFATVDDDDFEYLNQCKWFFNGRYATRKTPTQTDGPTNEHMHRVINKTPEGFETDHINKDKLDNRKENLRTATKQQNNFNRSSLKNTSSQFKGVSWRKDKTKWSAQIRINNKKTHLGYFGGESDAAKCYDVHAVKYHGEFASLNFTI